MKTFLCISGIWCELIVYQWNSVCKTQHFYDGLVFMQNKPYLLVMPKIWFWMKSGEKKSYVFVANVAAQDLRFWPDKLRACWPFSLTLPIQVSLDIVQLYEKQWWWWVVWGGYRVRSVTLIYTQIISQSLMQYRRLVWRAGLHLDSEELS